MSTPTSAERQALVERLIASWPSLAEQNSVRTQAASEIERFVEGEGASLPFRARSGVTWITLSPTAAGLQQELEQLRAWVVPSRGWLDPEQPFVTPAEATGVLSSAVLRASPTGYIRWWCAAADMPFVTGRLRLMRTLAAKRPSYIRERVPSLLELRQQFRTALLTRDRNAAEATLRTIDHYQLDSAVNTHLMRVRMLDQFGEYAAIVEDRALERLLGLRLPHSVRTALVRAFYVTLIHPHEAKSAEDAAIAYRDRVHHTLGGILGLARAGDGPEVARCLAYRAWATEDAREAAIVLPTVELEIADLLRPVIAAAAQSRPTVGLAEAVEEALRRGDIRALQEIAPSLLANLAASADRLQNQSLDAVKHSLEVLPNHALAETLARSGAVSSTAPAMPQDWMALVERLRAGEMAAAERFFALDESERPSVETLTAAERAAAIVALEEILTSPVFADAASKRWVADVALPAFVEDFVSDSRFPRAELMPLYMQLLRLWADHKRGSVYAPDGQLTLLLASVLLRQMQGSEEEVASLLVEWWRARPVRGALPFLLEALDTVLELIAADGPAQELWLDGAALAARDAASLSATERVLWRRLGLRAGFDASTVDEVLPEALTSAEKPPHDPLSSLGINKIAIVSLHRRSAADAQEILVERTGASVLVVDETVAGPGTRAAQSADVVLFVWAATKHAVFRAFDTVRDRVVYVQGTGSGSIVLALERWAIARAQ